MHVTKVREGFCRVAVALLALALFSPLLPGRALAEDEVPDEQIVVAEEALAEGTDEEVISEDEALDEIESLQDAPDSPLLTTPET